MVCVCNNIFLHTAPTHRHHKENTKLGVNIKNSMTKIKRKKKIKNKGKENGLLFLRKTKQKKDNNQKKNNNKKKEEILRCICEQLIKRQM